MRKQNPIDDKLLRKMIHVEYKLNEAFDTMENNPDETKRRLKHHGNIYPCGYTSACPPDDPCIWPRCQKYEECVQGCQH